MKSSFRQFCIVHALLVALVIRIPWAKKWPPFSTYRSGDLFGPVGSILAGQRQKHAWPKRRTAPDVTSDMHRFVLVGSVVLSGEIYLYGAVKLSYSLYGPENFEISCMALCSIFNAPYDTTVHSVRFLS